MNATQQKILEVINTPKTVKEVAVIISMSTSRVRELTTELVKQKLAVQSDDKPARFMVRQPDPEPEAPPLTGKAVKLNGKRKNLNPQQAINRMQKIAKERKSIDMTFWRTSKLWDIGGVQITAQELADIRKAGFEKWLDEHF